MTTSSATVTAPEAENLWSISRVAEHLGCSRRSVERLIACDRFPKPCVRVGNLPRWRPTVIREWVARGGK